MYKLHNSTAGSMHSYAKDARGQGSEYHNTLECYIFICKM